VIDRVTGGTLDLEKSLRVIRMGETRCGAEEDENG
jgi:hypothetical protein